MLEKIYFAKVKPDAIIPSKDIANAGYDIYACSDEDLITIQPNETKMIPTGIASSCSNDYYFQLLERGSTGSKGIGQRCGVIDSGYRGEWFCPLTNHNNKPILITKKTNQELLDMLSEDYIVYPYKKAICQAVLLPVPKTEVIQLSYDELKQIESDRGMGSLGSSGK